MMMRSSSSSASSHCLSVLALDRRQHVADPAARSTLLGMHPIDVAERWDAALRAGDWTTARGLLADDATYRTPEAVDPEYAIDCESADEIVDLMASFKGRMPDIEVVEWAEHGEHVLARLRQPAWGTDSDWWQVLTVRENRVARMVDFAREESALEAVRQTDG
jgi:hypothetical protein